MVSPTGSVAAPPVLPDEIAGEDRTPVRPGDLGSNVPLGETDKPSICCQGAAYGSAGDPIYVLLAFRGPRDGWESPVQGLEDVGFDTDEVPLEVTSDAAFTCNPNEEIDAPFGSCNWADTEMTAALTFFRATDVDEMMSIAKATQASLSSLNPS